MNDTKRALSRRSFLKFVAFAATAAVLDACTPQSTPQPTTPAGASSPTKPAATATPAPTAAKLEKELRVLNWGDYIDFAIKPFEEKFNCKVTIEYFGSEDEAISKIKAAGFGVYDTVNLGVGYLKPVVQMGLIEPLDVKRIPSYELSYERFKPGPFEVDGKIYGVCYAWGTNALMYNTELAPAPVDSWAAFWDPKFAGKTSLVDKAKDQYLAAMLYLGLDFVHPSLDDWPKVTKAIKERVKLMKTLWSSGDDITRYIINKEVWLADMYDGLGHQIEEQFPAAKYVIPKEGTYGWFDGPLMVKGAPHPNLTYEWINFVTSTEMAKLVAEQVKYCPGNSKVADLLDPKLRTQLGLDKPAETLKGLRFWEALGPEWDRRILDAWTEAKASA